LRPRRQPILDDSLRNPVKQQRSKQTVAAMEDAIRQLLRDPAVGRDRFTTAQVAELSGSSIGSVYRYFPNREAMLDRVWPDRPGTYLPDEPPATP
jgi:AcrR family transcriptional regulator